MFFTPFRDQPFRIKWEMDRMRRQLEQLRSEQARLLKTIPPK